MSGNPDLLAQGRSDEAACQAESAKASGADIAAVMQACMDKRGYEIIVLPPGETFEPIPPPPGTTN